MLFTIVSAGLFSLLSADRGPSGQFTIDTDQRVHLLAEINAQTRVMGYTFGYTVGYVGEQVAMGAATGGVGKVVQVVRRGGLALAGSLAKRTVANLAARGYLLKEVLAAGDELTAEVIAAHQRGFSKASIGPTGEGMPRLPMEMMQEAAGDGARFVWKHYVGDSFRPNIKRLVKQGGEDVIQRRLSQLIYMLGPDFNDEIGRNFMKIADEIILVPGPDETVDQFFEGFFRAFTGNPSELAHADTPRYTKIVLQAQGHAALLEFLSNPTAGKLWNNFDEVTFYNNRVRGVLAELSIYKRRYKALGYSHAPNATGYDFAGPKWVQIKTVQNPSIAYSNMRDAINALIANSPSAPTPLRFHILRNPSDTLAAASNQLEADLRDFMLNDLTQANRDRLELIVEAFELTP